MAAEKRRGCGFRKVGGLYLVGEVTGFPCCRLPIPLTVCPCCGAGIKQSLGWQWVDPRPFLQTPCKGGRFSTFCPGTDPNHMGERVGLLWIGRGFYPTVESFLKEGIEQGISKRIAGIPRGFELGKTWVWLAHPKATAEGKPGVFYVWRPQRLEKIITDVQAQDAELMADLEKRSITPIIVPHNDKAHQGSVYDKDEPDLFEEEQ